MELPALSVAALGRDLGDVARGLPEWRRGDPEDAIGRTLATSGADLHARVYTLWVWTGATSADLPAWLLPIRADSARRFAPNGPARALARCLAAAVRAGGAPRRLQLAAWRGYVRVAGNGLDNELAQLALEEVHPPGTRIAVAPLPGDVVLDGPPIDLPVHPLRAGPLGKLAEATGAHPVDVALALAHHGQPVDLDIYPPELVRSLREWGLDGTPVVAPVVGPSLAVDDDPCPRRRHARRVLRRLLRMRKVGEQHHTEFDHMYRGAAPNERATALEVARALVRAGLLGEKPSVGQHHVFLRPTALPQIHALIDRGETADPVLAEMWTAPAPGSRRLP